MKQAELSISLCNNNKIAQDIAQIIILDNNLNSLEMLSDLSKRSNSNLNLSYFYSVAPVFMNTIGVFLLNFGNVTTTTFEILLFLAGLVNSMGFLESTENTTPKLLGKADSLSTDNE
ncbi:MAG: hypothetical protein HQK72_09350 [Desulfamplus sp.]|nr:hypothetical protein [Desulfamplus sp.]